ncbi:MAG: hypothetical protein Ta2E_12070 [Mycoplasmoidaceae bacterium]|nr:MAG: hypothetical protein Ta2E_12070 [Mycoplasmoidaceae bacterium]
MCQTEEEIEMKEILFAEESRDESDYARKFVCDGFHNNNGSVDIDWFLSK